MKDGWVRSVSNTTITIADTSGEEPAYGWEYTHLGNSLVQVGQFVTRGTKIGEVDFHGTAHIHLTKVFSQGQYWGQWRYVCMPNGHFTYLDEEPPVIGDSFYFFENNSNTEIKPNQRGDIVVRGQVDIVVPMREQGLYARSNDNGFGDRLGITRIEYEIRPKGTAPNSGKQFKSFDFKNIKIKKSTNNKAYNTELTKVVYKHWTLLERERSSWNRVFSYYTITNCTGDRSPRELFVTDRDFCWDTSALDQTGNSVFPNGIYDIMVTAYDYFGNHTTRTVSVRVHNLAEGPH